MRRYALILLLCLGADGGHKHVWRCPAFPAPGCNAMRTCTCACGEKQTQVSEDCP